MTRTITVVLNGLFALLWLSMPVHAQVYTQRVSAGTTLSRWGILSGADPVSAIDLPELNTAPFIAEDEQRAKQGVPLRIGVSLPVSLDLMQTDSPVQHGSFRVRSYRINAPGAVAVSVLFDRLQLAEGAQVFIYDANKTMLFGPVTPAQNGTGFWTDFLTGASVIIEVQEPIQTAGQSMVQVAGVVHSYRNVTGSPKSFGTVGGSGGCEVNMVCQPAYQSEGDAVALILASYGGYTYACTGSVINSARQDFRSYFLTAFHCVDFNGDGSLGSGETAAYANAQFRFNWQSPTCTPSQEDPNYVTLSGAVLKAARSDSDFSLFEFNTQLPPTENITYLGWNRSSDNAASVTGIHHPQGDVKKISSGGSTIVSGYGTSGTDHLTAFWTTGATEGGSSGSPLLDQNRRIIGQLHGGPSYCGAPAAVLKDYYGRFYTSWDAGGSPETQLKDYLDPANTGVLTTDEAKAAITGAASFTGTATFSLNVGAGTSVFWSVSNGTSAVSVPAGTGPIATLVAASGASNTPITLLFTVNDGQPYPIRFSRTITVTADVVPPQAFAFLPPLYDCATGAITFRTVGGDGSPVEFRAVGVTDWTTTPNQVVDAPVRGDGQALTLMARQHGVIITTPFDFRGYCAGQTPPGSTTQPATPSALTLLPPAYTCSTGAITFRTVGGDGSPVEFRAVGVTDWTLNPNQVVDAPVRGDGEPLTLMARQAGIVVQSPFDFRAYCRNVNARVGGEISTTNWQLRTLGNPVNATVLRADVQGAAGQLLRWQLIDLTGRLLEERLTVPVDVADPQSFNIKNYPAGLLLLRVSTGEQTQTIRIMKTE